MELMSTNGKSVIATPIQSLHYRHRDGLKKPFKYDWNDQENVISCYNDKGDVTEFQIRMDQNDWIVYDGEIFERVDVTVINKDYFDKSDFTGQLF